MLPQPHSLILKAIFSSLHHCLLSHLQTVRTHKYTEGGRNGFVTSYLLIDSSEILELFLIPEYTYKCPQHKCHAAHCDLN